MGVLDQKHWFYFPNDLVNPLVPMAFFWLSARFYTFTSERREGSDAEVRTNMET